jgi:hypothetical protein
MTQRRQGRMSTIIRWEFSRGHERVSCQVDSKAERGAGAAFDVALVPSSRLVDEASETFDSVAPALRRHAMLASSLRDTGWRLVAYTR